MPSLFTGPASHRVAIAPGTPAGPIASVGFRGDRRRASGFTLVEFVLVVAVIGVLAALCLPAYADYTRRTYVTEGLILSAVAKARVVEEVSVNASGSDGFFSTSSGAPPGAPPLHEMVEQNPSRMIKHIIRASTSVIVTYNRALDPGNRVEYSLALVGVVPLGGGKMIFRCLSGLDATGALNRARNAGAPVGEPLPTEWAPASCRD